MPRNHKRFFVLRRVCKFLTGVQDIVESLTWDSVKFGRVIKLGSGGLKHKYQVRWWVPATWVAWLRTVILRDDFGCVYYRRSWYPKSIIGKSTRVNLDDQEE